MRVIAFDPEVTRVAYSIWDDEELVEVGFLQRNYPYLYDFLSRLFDFANDHWVSKGLVAIEGQWLHPRARRKNVLTFQRLIEVREEIKNTFILAGWHVVVVPPQRWQIDILHCQPQDKRAKRKLLAQGVAKPYLEKLNVDEHFYDNHNIADAVCIGLWATHRFFDFVKEDDDKRVFAVKLEER